MENNCADGFSGFSVERSYLMGHDVGKLNFLAKPKCLNRNDGEETREGTGKVNEKRPSSGNETRLY